MILRFCIYIYNLQNRFSIFLYYFPVAHIESLNLFLIPLEIEKEEMSDEEKKEISPIPLEQPILEGRLSNAGFLYIIALSHKVNVL